MQRLILCGGGHVSLETAWMASRLEFEITVLDDRAEFACKDRFPMASQVLAMPFLEALEQLGSRPSDFFVILTRGHTHDADCLAQILRGQYAYVGMIGSRSKTAAIRKRMGELGFSEQQLVQLHAPIGLPIGAQTPAEIAVSILSEIVQVRAGLGPSLSPPPREPGVLVTVTRKSGSAPRQAGAWMLVRPDGFTVGTIGGGAAEHQAIQEALALWAGGGSTAQGHYDLSAAAELGMVCGGTIDVSFQVQR